MNLRLFLPAVLLLCFTTKSKAFFPGNDADTLQKRQLRMVAGTGLGTYVAGISFLGFIWYHDHEPVPFHFYNDNRGYLQMDKIGHAYGSYWESRAVYGALRWAGLDHKRALLWGGPAGLVFQTPIEIFDGLYEGWGFSWGDMAANTFGSALFMAQQAAWEEQIVLMKFSYSPSGYPEYHEILGENEVESFFLDYNGHTYWLSANMKTITGFEKLPPWLNVAFGHSANGLIKEFNNPLYYNGLPFPHLERYRQWMFSLDIDFSRIKTKKRWVRNLCSAVNLLKVPFPALEYNRIDGFMFRPVYF